jgi:hypothetical protein
MIIKLDMVNSFDLVKHSFIFSVLKAYGFSDDFINWIEACIGSPWITPLVNGRLSCFFKASIGLRQGFPLSPYLYILLVDSLSWKLEEEIRINRIPSLLIARGVKELNHSQFVDDTLLLGADTIIIAKCFHKFLDSFLSASGGKLNNFKFHIYGWNVLRHIRDHMSIIFGFPFIITWTHFKYLGMPTFLNSYGSFASQDIIDKILSWIQSWGGC